MAGIIDSAISNVKSLYDLAVQFNNADLLLMIAELKSQLADIKTLEASTRLENLNLKAKLQEDTENPLEISVEGILFDSRHIAYCSGCYGSSHKRIYLRTDRSEHNWTLYSCPVCKESFQIGSLPPGDPMRYKVIDQF
jgi:hypothetical protein